MELTSSHELASDGPQSSTSKDDERCASQRNDPAYVRSKSTKSGIWLHVCFNPNSVHLDVSFARHHVPFGLTHRRMI